MTIPDQDQYSPADGLEEHEIESIIDSRKRGRGYQSVVHWVGFGPEEYEWLSHKYIKDCQALDTWYAQGGDGPEHPHPRSFNQTQIQIKRPFNWPLQLQTHPAFHLVFPQPTLLLFSFSLIPF